LSGTVFGLFLIYLGSAFVLENLNLVYIEDILAYCPSFLIASGIIKLWDKGIFNIWGQILLSGGSLLQTACLWNTEAIEVWWPVMIVWIGIIVALRAFLPNKYHPNVRVISCHEHHCQRHNDIDAISVTVEHED
jgi:hypothetical protein